MRGAGRGCPPAAAPFSAAMRYNFLFVKNCFIPIPIVPPVLDARRRKHPFQPRTAHATAASHRRAVRQRPHLPWRGDTAPPCRRPVLYAGARGGAARRGRAQAYRPRLRHCQRKSKRVRRAARPARAPSRPSRAARRSWPASLEIRKSIRFRAAIYSPRLAYTFVQHSARDPGLGNRRHRRCPLGRSRRHAPPPRHASAAARARPPPPP